MAMWCAKYLKLLGKPKFVSCNCLFSSAFSQHGFTKCSSHGGDSRSTSTNLKVTYRNLSTLVQLNLQLKDTLLVLC